MRRGSMTIKRHAPPHHPFDMGADDGMGFRRIRPHDHDQFRLLKICDRIGRSGRPERFHHPGDRRAVADTRAVVDMICADHATHEFPEQVIFFVCAPAGRYRRQRVGAMRALDPVELTGDPVQRRIPRDFLPFVAPA